MKTVRALLHLAIVMCLAGCAIRPEGTVYQTIPEPPAQFAQVVIYRLPTIASIVHPVNFWVDGKAAATLEAKGYTYFLVKPGAREVHAGGTPAYRGALVPFTAQPGMTYYFQFGTVPGSANVIGGTPVVGLSGAFLRQVSESLAKSQLPEYGFQAPVLERVDLRQ